MRRRDRQTAGANHWRARPWRLAGGAAAALLAGAVPRLALAYDGGPAPPTDLWRAWSWQPPLLLGLGFVAWLYGRGVYALWRRAGAGHGIGWGQAAAFFGGIASLFVALASPLDMLGAVLLSAHMIQQLAFTVLAAPLLVLGAPQIAFLWALPRPWRRAFGRWWRSRSSQGVRASWHAFNTPLVAWVLQGAVLWAWHMPRLYQVALHNQALQGLEHTLFLSTAALFWWTIVYPGERRSYPISLFAVAAMALQSGALGALLAFAQRPWYADYAAGYAAWRLTPLADQQLAGMMMWVPAGLIYVLAAAALCLAWLATTEGGRRDEPAIEPRPRAERAGAVVARSRPNEERASI